MTNLDSEDSAVEQPTIALLGELGWTTENCFHETLGAQSSLGRETRQEVVLRPRLRTALQRFNPDLPARALDLAEEELTRDRSALLPARANQEVYRLLKDGVKVAYRDDAGEDASATVQVIDWKDPESNDFFLASQLWIAGDVYTRRTDLIGFVNGLPLVFIELKASHKHLKDAYKNNLRDYRATIPQLFWYNAVILLSNGSQSRIGSTFAPWEHFAEWKKINSEGEEGIISLDTVLRGVCAPAHLLDLAENFTLFSEESGGLIKLVAKNHQFLGVNAAFQAVKDIKGNAGRLGVFWHTQGSGKTGSMVFFAQKVFRKLPGNFTFLLVTDRQELDDQVYQTFARAGAITETEDKVHADSGEHLRTLMREDHRYLFTLIQKFRTERGEAFPVLSDRSDIIVVTDEAHRSQYDIFAQNMRSALPNAAFLGFTGTPLMAGEEKTRHVFGDYVSVYNFAQSIEDGATVPLYYENRIPELQLTNAELNDDMERLLEEAELDEAQERKLEREFRREYQLITREDRLERIAEDIVQHYLGRGWAGKAMVISIDKVTAARMYDKVKKHWAARLDGLRATLPTLPPEERGSVELQIKSMAETDMALVVSQSQNEAADMAAFGVNILPHRLRMKQEDLATRFKKAEDPLRIVFVCAMWITGFDVPSCSTIYLDKPQRNHTLMQTIARANRVFGDKTSGLIVDYVGVFRNLQKALAIYGTAGGDAVDGEHPVADKAQLVAALDEAVREAKAFCTGLGIDLSALKTAQGFERIKCLDEAVEALVSGEETKRKFLALASTVTLTFRAILPDPAANQFGPDRALFAVLAEKIGSLTEEADIADVLHQMDDLLDESVAADAYVIRERPEGYRTYDLSKIDFEALRARFASGHKHTEAQKLQAALGRQLRDLLKLNKSRMNYLEQYQAMIADYNSGSSNVDEHYQMLLDFTQALSEEQARPLVENLSEEELAVYDLLTKPALDLTDAERKDIKRLSQDLLVTLKREKLVLDWRKRQQSRAAVRLSVEEALDRLPPSFTTETYQLKCDRTYQHIFESYYGEGRSVYQMGA